MASKPPVTVSDSSGETFLDTLGFARSMGGRYYPTSSYPHLHVGLGQVFDHSEETVRAKRWNRVFQRWDEPVPVVKHYGRQTLGFLSFHRAGEARARHIWSSDSGWAGNLGAAVPKLKSDGLYPVCKQILQRFQMDVGQLPSEFD